ncbi:MAG TPA: hypothetical protein VGG10_16835 [Rhizomicrobium sp.]
MAGIEKRYPEVSNPKQFYLFAYPVCAVVAIFAFRDMAGLGFWLIVAALPWLSILIEMHHRRMHREGYSAAIDDVLETFGGVITDARLSDGKMTALEIDRSLGSALASLRPFGPDRWD